MKIGMHYRNWGPHAARENLLVCARIADESLLDSIWVNDHIGFPLGEGAGRIGAGCIALAATRANERTDGIPLLDHQHFLAGHGRSS